MASSAQGAARVSEVADRARRDAGASVLVVTTSYPRFAGDPAGNFVAHHAAELRAEGKHVRVIAGGDDVGMVSVRNKITEPHERDAATAARLDHDSARRAWDAHQNVTRVPSHLLYRGGAPDALTFGDAASSSVGRARAGDVWRSRWAALGTTTAFARAVLLAPATDQTIAHWLAPSALVALPRRGELTAIAHGGDVYVLRSMGLLGVTLAALAARDARLVLVAPSLWRVADAAVRTHAVRRWFARRAEVQPMRVDESSLHGLPRPAPDEPPLVLVIARLVPIKGVDVAIDAMRIVKAARPDVRLVIVGDGPERSVLEQRGRGVAEFAGAVTTSERDAWLARAHIVLVPSRVVSGREEGTPLVAMEALAAGRHVIGTRTGGLAALPIVHVEPEDARGLAAAVMVWLTGQPAPNDRALNRAVR